MPKTKNTGSGKKSSSESSSSSSSTSSSSSSSSSSSDSDYSVKNKRLRREVNTLKKKLRHKRSAYQGKIESVPHFSGAFDDSMNVTQWLNNIEVTGDVFEWDEKARIFCMINRLRGNAKTWYHNQDNLKLAWKDWKKKLEEAFPPQQSVFTKLKELVNVQREPAQPLVDFYYRKLALGQQCQLQDKVLVDIVANTINDPFLKSGIRAAACVSTKQLLQFLISNTERPRDVQYEQSRPNRYSHNKQTTPGLMRDEGLTCYLCGKDGHKRINCSRYQSNKLCTFCNKKGHVESECFKKQRQGESSKRE